MSSADLVVRTRISRKNFLGMDLFTLVLGGVICFLGFRFATGVNPLLIVVAAIAPLLIAQTYGWLVRANTEYRIYSDSLEIESGILSRKIDNIQLFRIRDLGLDQPLLGRMLGFGNLTLASTDQSAPHLVLRGVDDPRSLYETLRELIAKSQAARRTMIVEEELTS
jgi:uncharacterized membrane protein YdbT with pleckstrin-like domain